MFSTGILLSLITGILLIIGWLAAGFWGIGTAFIIAAIIIITSYAYCERFLLRVYNARPTKNVLLENTVREISRDAGLPPPQIYMIDTDESVPNSFSVGKSPRRSCIVVTSGITELEQHEIEAVIAHELGHIKSGHNTSRCMAAMIGSVISYPANHAYWAIRSDKTISGSISLSILMALFGGIAAFLIRISIPEIMEYKADYLSAVITKSPKSLVSALEKISVVFEEKTIRGPVATSHLWIVNPFSDHWLTRFFSTHPPTDKRINGLKYMHGDG